jgi:transcriptional regulator GlxA family with amidase domain
MQEAFPRISMSAGLFTLDRSRFTSSGGSAPMDMMLHLIGRDHGCKLSADISETFVYECINEQDHQRVPLKHVLDTHQTKLQEIVALMEANLEEPIDLDHLVQTWTCHV